jgi:GNAT superfamily N-acetyltransferase
MTQIDIRCDKHVTSEEFARLMSAVGWGDEAGYDLARVRRSIEAYPFVAHARAEDRSLVGYVSAFSDEVFSVFLGELVVHPAFQRQGIGSRLLRTVESRYAGVPVYVKPFAEQQPFFERNGYARPRRAMAVLYKRNDRPG